MAHPVLFPSSLLANKWFRKDPLRTFWWMDLVSMATPVDGCTVLLEGGERIKCSKGTVITTRGLLSKRWNVSRDKVKNFLALACREKLIEATPNSKYTQIFIFDYNDYVPDEPGASGVFTQGITHPEKPVNVSKSDDCKSSKDGKLPTRSKITHNVTHSVTHVNDCKSDNYADVLPTELPTSLPAASKITQTITHPKKYVKRRKSGNYNDGKDGDLPTFLPTSYEKQEMKETENETENISPTPPIKEKDKEKESKEPLTRGCGFSKAETTFRAHAREPDLEKQKKAEERKTRSEEKKQKQKALVTKGREIFEAFFKEQYGESYYWEAKDAAAMARVFKKITFRRMQRTPPLPVDDDSLVNAFSQFLHSINKTWITNNFSMPKIDSQYNDIISEIQNQKRNGKNFSNTATEGRTRLESQAITIVNDIAKADELYYRNRQESRRTPQEVQPVATD